MYISTTINSQGTLRVFAVYQRAHANSQDRTDLVATLHGVMAKDIDQTFNDVVTKHFGNSDCDPISYEFTFSTF